MSSFLRLLSETDKAQALATACSRLRNGEAESRCFDVQPESFDAVPGKPFAYWVSEAVRATFRRLPPFETSLRCARLGSSARDDFRYLRCSWEVQTNDKPHLAEWRNLAKGGVYSPFYADIYLMVHWEPRRSTFLGFFGRPGREIAKPESVDYFFRSGLTWPRRTQGGLSMRAMPAGCIFADKGPAAFVSDDAPDNLLALLAIVNSSPFKLLVSLQMAFGSYEVGVIQRTPVPELKTLELQQFSTLARRAWSLKRTLDTVVETSHAFLLPAAIRSRQDDYDQIEIESALARIQAEIDEIAFDLYGFCESDRLAALGNEAQKNGATADADEDDDADNDEVAVLSTDGLLSWSVGVAFGRFDCRLATGERQAPQEPQPFDPLPTKSPGMLPDGAVPLHIHMGILVDDQGHPHDLTRIVEGVLDAVDAPVSNDVRLWLQKDLFAFHLKHYSKSRRKAPIYWPLTTTSGSYTLWLYYPTLNDQTLFTAVNDFVDPKLDSVRKDLQTLRLKGTGRSKQEEKDLETLSSLEQELADLRDVLLEIAPNYRPSHDDGAQISAAPLWKLFCHKPWQKILKDTWAKLEKGDYDWAYLAMNYWPDRVRGNCVTDKSLAIAHDLEHLYIEPEPKPVKARGRKKAGSNE